MPKITAFDIETDTSPLTEEELAQGYTSRGLDPRITPITSFASASHVIGGPDLGPNVQILDDIPEKAILSGLGSTLTSNFTPFKTSLLVTWNGSVFDIPFIHDRAEKHGVKHDFEMTPNPLLVPKYNPTPGHEGGYTATWAGIPHIDIAYVVKADAEARGVKWSLKPYAKSIGLDPIEVDRERMHELTPSQRRDYVASDAIITLEVAKRVLGFV